MFTREIRSRGQALFHEKGFLFIQVLIQGELTRFSGRILDNQLGLRTRASNIDRKAIRVVSPPLGLGATLGSREYRHRRTFVPEVPDKG